jgi:hypothetical protein
MSLTKKRTMTAKRIAANQANGKRSHGPVSPAGRTRIREANTRHGFYSQAETAALACLGEDPEELQRLRKNLLGDFAASSALEKELAEHMVEVVWRWKRAGRMQEGFALRLAKDTNLTRENRVHAQMMRLKIMGETLRRLAQSVAQEDYCTRHEDLEMMKNLHQEGAVKEVGEIALALFYQLQKPGTDDQGLDVEEQSRRAANRLRAIFGLGPAETDFVLVPSPQQLRQGMTAPTEPIVMPASNRSPGSPQDAGATPRGQQDAGATCEAQQEADIDEVEEEEPAELSPEEEARERARQLLENILTRQVELCETQREAILRESMAGPSPYERAAEIALAHPNTALMQRMEESSFRQIWRISTLLLKIKSHARQEQSRETAS